MTGTDTGLRDRITQGFAAILSANVVGMALKGLSILVLTRYLLSPAEYGLLFLTLSIVGFTQLFADLGIARSAAYYVSEYRETDEPQVPHIIRVALAYNLVTIAVVGVCLFVFSGQIARLVGEPSVTPFIALGSVYIGVRSLTVFVRTTFQGLNRVSYSALVTSVVRVGEFVFVVGLTVLTGEVIGAFLGFVLSYAIGAAVGGGILYVRFYRPLRTDRRMEQGLARRVFRYNVPLTMTKGAGAVLSKTDIVLIGFFWNPLIVGFYTLALQVAEFISTPASSLGFVISPTFGEHKAKNDLERAARVYEQSFRHTLLLYLPGAAGLFLVADPAIGLIFGTDYANATPVVQVLSVFVVLNAVNAITNTTLDYLGQARLRAYTKIGGAGLNIALNVALIPVFGAVGAAAATVVTYGLIVGLNLYLLFRSLPLSRRQLGAPAVQVGVIAAAVAIAVWPMMRFVSGIVTLGAVVLLGVGVWAVLSIASGVLATEQIRSALAGLRLTGDSG